MERNDKIYSFLEHRISFLVLVILTDQLICECSNQGVFLLFLEKITVKYIEKNDHLRKRNVVHKVAYRKVIQH